MPGVGFLLVNNDEGSNFLSLRWSKGVKVSFEDSRLSLAWRGISMMRLLILVVVILSLAAQVRSQVPKRYDVVGPAKSLRQETAKLTTLNGETVEGPRVLIETATYDSHGHATERVVNNPDGTLKWKAKWIARSIYDSEDRETERVSYNDQGEVASRTVWVYDTNGNLNKSITYGAAGEIRFYDSFKYDDNRRKIRADYLYGDGSPRGYDVFAYDTLGHLTEIIHSEGILQHRDSYKYDDQGNQTEWSAYDQNGIRGLKVSWGYTDDSKSIPTEFVQYDSRDKVVSKEVYTYEFDSRGNWIKSKTRREVFSGLTPIVETEITYRTITYRQAR
jgi:hypothetical protein